MKKSSNISKFSKIALAATVAVPAAVAVQGTSASAAANAETDFTASAGAITHYKGAAGAVEIPDTIGGVSVTEIGDNAFYSYPTHIVNTVTSVIIPNTVTKIGATAFKGQTTLQPVHIPKSVTTIAADAFESGRTIKGLTTTLNRFNLAGVTEVATDYRVTYDANGGTGAPTDSTLYDLNEKAVVKDKGSLKNGKLIFDGWNTQADGSGVDYAASADTAALTGNITLYAQWKEATSKYVKPDSVAFGTPGYTGYIEIQVFNDDKKTPISEELNVKITDKNGATVQSGKLTVVTGATPSATFKTTTGTKPNTTTTVGNLAPGTYYVTLSDNNGNKQTTTVPVTSSKKLIKPIWETSLDGIITVDAVKNTSKILNSGAISGVVYANATTASTASVDTGSVVKIKNATTTWTTTTDANGTFTVYVPKGKYDVIVEGKNGNKHQIYSAINVVAGTAISPINKLSTAIAWGSEAEKALGFDKTKLSGLTGALVTGTPYSKTASGTFKGLANPGTTVEVYLVDDNEERVFISEAKTGAAPKTAPADGSNPNKLGTFSLKAFNPYNAKDANKLANKKVEFVVTDAAGNSYTSDIVDIPTIFAPSTITATVAAGTTKDTSAITVASPSTGNVYVVTLHDDTVPSATATPTVKVGDDINTIVSADTALIDVVRNYTTKSLLTTKTASKTAKYAKVYEVDAAGKVVKFKTIIIPATAIKK